MTGDGTGTGRSRVYVALTPADLAGLATSRVLDGGERFTAPDDSEEGEYAALMTAADASARLQSGWGRRVVVVAEVLGEDARIELRDVVAVHMDTEDRDAGADPDDDLAWFAPQEIGHL